MGSVAVAGPYTQLVTKIDSEILIQNNWRMRWTMAGFW